jgi:hypothetical protein
LDGICVAEDQDSQPGKELAEKDDDIASDRTQEIRTPHSHDVLFGNGGPVYYHAGNIQFRKWISEHKRSYRFASNHEKKRRIVREIIGLVQNQNPPGRFLQRGPTLADLWIEADDGRAAKTCLALFRATRAELLKEVEETEPRGKMSLIDQKSKLESDSMEKL